MRLHPKIVRGQQRLTPEQEAYARQFARERIAAMLSTAPINTQEAESHLRAVYRAARVKPPSTIRWFDSPLSFVQACVPGCVRGGVKTSVWDGMEARAQDGMWTNVWKSMWDSIWTSVPYHVWSSVWASMEARDQPGIWTGVPDSVWASIRASVPDNAWTSIETSVPDGMWATVEASVWRFYRSRVPACVWVCAWVNVEASVSDDVWTSMPARVRDSVWDKVETSVGANVWASLNASVRAFYNASTLAFYRFFHEAFEANKLIHLAYLNEMVSGYWLGSKEAWMVCKPTSLERDAQGRPHSASGPCVQYRDGWGVYAWHGVRVPEKVILHPAQLTKEDWISQRNVEVRRVIQERLGNERFIEMVGGKQIDAGRRGKLIEIDLGRGDPERVAHYVQVQDSSTRRHYYLRVPPSITRADDAIAWTFGLDARDYQPGQET